MGTMLKVNKVTDKTRKNKAGIHSRQNYQTSVKSCMLLNMVNLHFQCTKKKKVCV